MKTKYFSTILMTIILILCGIIIAPNYVQADNTTYSDFSNAEYKLEYGESGTALITISNVSFSDNSSSYYAYLTTDSSENPDADSIVSNFTFGLVANNENALYSTQSHTISSYVELNKDLYLWVVQYGTESKEIVVNGQKIEKPDYPEYTDVFESTTLLTADVTQICFNVPWGIDTTRTFEIKIGKITDTAILKSLKNGEGTSLSSLLTYAKSASSIYDENLTSTSTTYNKTSISLSGLEDESYYYLYVVFDDEDGKYVPIEGITFAQADVYESLGNWFMFFYGDDDFSWTDFEVADTNSTDNTQPKTDDSESTGKNDDSTTTSSNLPYTGAFGWISATIIIIGIIGGVCYIKTQKYKGI